MLFKNKENFSNIVLLDCFSGEISQTNEFPCQIGDSEDCKLRIPVSNIMLEITPNADNTFNLIKKGSETILFNSSIVEEHATIESSATLQIGELLYIIFSGKDALKKARKVNVKSWFLFDVKTGSIEDEMPFNMIKSSVIKRGLTGGGLAISPKGCELGFFYGQVFRNEDSESCEDFTIPMMSQDSEAVTCPLCWLKFDIGDAMSIATHENLRGDPILGADEMLRFLPTCFNDFGIAIDSMGLPAPDVACPHCRKKLPTNFLNLDIKILSIVGAPSSGKSYYLSVLAEKLKEVLIQKFSVRMKDLDPTGNMVLTSMKNKLFSATTPEEAILAKTAFEGSMYERYRRFGKLVALPKPITYSLSSEKNERDTCIVFYDNAGEHFEPGLDIEDSPGAMHIASSSAIFFIFDPAANYSFKKSLTNSPDPQLLIKGRIDQQDTILSEMEVRIKRVLGISSTSKIDTPLAIIINKYDIWKELLKESLSPYFVDNKFDMNAVENNSRILREFMMAQEPSIVASAEGLSSDVKYFAVSPLGHTPVKIESGQYAGMIAPDPAKLNPINVEIPTLWALTKNSDILDK